MADKIIMCIISLICAFMFFGIGVYSKKISKPMGLWSGTEVDGSKIIDIKKYNNANGNIMNTVYVIRFKIDKIIQD